ncbi:hypothetical protein BD309DRAFT_948420 [Dichomitus squalens]|nr:hypothetical protein BD309DRAFT_948420 [Dichomitus squalens]
MLAGLSMGAVLTILHRPLRCSLQELLHLEEHRLSWLLHAHLSFALPSSKPCCIFALFCAAVGIAFPHVASRWLAS